MYASEYPFHNQHEVIFHDLDAMGHVNNATYFIYMETVRIKYVVDKLNLSDDNLRSSMVVAEACCTYHAPAFQHDLLTIGVGVSRFGNKSFDLLYRIDAPDRLILTGKTTQVSYDYDQQQAIAVPEDFRARVTAYQGDWQVPNE